MRYRLPEVLGGGEYEVSWQHETNAPIGTVPFIVERGCIVYVAKALLTEVKPPMPEEPPVGSVGRCDEGYIHIRQGRSWTNHDDVPATWSEVYSHGFTLLVPDPFAEPVELPAWGVSVRSNSVMYGQRLLDSAEARMKARALWAAADAAEKEQP